MLRWLQQTTDATGKPRYLDWSSLILKYCFSILQCSPKEDFFVSSTNVSCRGSVSMADDNGPTGGLPKRCHSSSIFSLRLWEISFRFFFLGSVSLSRCPIPKLNLSTSETTLVTLLDYQVRRRHSPEKIILLIFCLGVQFSRCFQKFARRIASAHAQPLCSGDHKCIINGMKHVSLIEKGVYPPGVYDDIQSHRYMCSIVHISDKLCKRHMKGQMVY